MGVALYYAPKMSFRNGIQEAPPFGRYGLLDMSSTQNYFTLWSSASDTLH
jgi:hypothetical protein